MDLFGSQAGGVAHLIQTAVAPVFLLSAVAGTLSVLTNRLARIVDRAREIEARLAGTVKPVDADELHERLRVMARRAHYINVAITLSTIAAILVALVVTLLFARTFFGAEFAGTIAALFVASMMSLAGAFIAFLVEVRIATATLRIGARHL